MKKTSIFLLLIVPFILKATTYTSVHTLFPGNWTSPSTWGVTSGYPTAGDIAIIANNTTVSINTNVSVLNVTINHGGTLQFPLLSGSTLTVYGNFINNGTFTSNALTFGTVDFAGTSNQVIRGSVAPTFYKLTIAPSTTVFVTLDTSITVSNTLTISQGTLNTPGSQISGGLLSTLTMAAGTTLLLGTPYLSTLTVPSFPSGFTTVTLNLTSTVDYQSTSSSQQISATPTYGNLIVGGGGGISSPTKNPTGNLTVAGNLTINSSTTFDVSSSNYNITLAGNFTNNGTFAPEHGTVTFNGTSQTIGGSNATTLYTMSISSGSTVSVSPSNYILTLGGNFTDNGSFTGGSGTVVMDGTSAETIGGSNVTTFNNLTINGTSTVTLANSEITTSNLLISTGTLAASTYSLTVGGNFTNNSTFTSSGTVTMDGTGIQTMGGTSATTFNNLVISSGTTNATSYSFSVAGSFTDNATFTQTSGTTTMTGSSSQIGGSGTTTFNKLTIGSGTTSTAGNYSTTSDITISSSATLSMPNSPAYTIYTKGNFIDLGTFTSGTAGTVNFDNMGKQCISGINSSTIVSFYNLTVSPVSILGTSCVVHVTGIATILPGGQMLCACN